MSDQSPVASADLSGSNPLVIRFIEPSGIEPKSGKKRSKGTASSWLSLNWIPDTLLSFSCLFAH